MATIDGNNSSNSISGGSGNDQISGGGGNDTLFGGTGNDRVEGDSGNDTIYGGLGNDRLEGGSGNDRIWGDDGDDRIDGDSSNDTIYGGFGHDRISGGSGADRLYGDAGNDDITGSSDDDTIYGGAGNDALEAGSGDDLVFGNDDNDQIDGDSGDDTIYGGQGNDVISGGSGADRVHGDEGNDLLLGSSSDDTLYGGDGNDALVGNGGRDRLFGGAGNDLIAGSSGNDTMYGGDDDDVFVGGGGRDRIFGGDGSDSAVYAHDRSHYTITTGVGGDVTIRHIGSDEYDVLSGVEFARFDDQTVALGAAPNQAPVTAADSASASEDNATSATGNVLANDSDPEGATLAVLAPGVFAGTYGTLTLAADGAYTYALNNGAANVQALTQGETVTDTFSYAATDGSLSTGSALTVTITGANDTAVIGGVSTGGVTEDLGVVAGNLSISGALTVDDADAGQSSFVAQSGTAGSNGYGTFSLNAAGSWTYTADNGQVAIQSLGAGQTLTDSFTAASSDGSASQIVTVTITGSNDGPTANADVAVGTENSPVLVNVVGNDTDLDAADPLTLIAVGAPVGGGSASIQGNQLRFDPSADFQHLADGVDAQVSVAYTIQDSQGAQSVSTLALTVSGTNDVPVAVADSAAAGENQTILIDVLANDTDVDDAHVLSLVSATIPSGQGSLAIVDGKLQFDPGADFDDLGAGVQEVVVGSYTMQDEYGAKSTASVTITVTGTNDAPVITAVSGATNEDGTALATLSISDVDGGDVLSYSLDITGSHNGMLTDLGNGTVSYTPDADWSGSDTFTYTASDDHGGTTAPANIVFTVAPVADTPNLSLAATKATGDIGSPIVLGISAALADTDGSEVLRVEITGLSSSWSLSAGSYQEDIGAWVVSGPDLPGLTATPPAGVQGTFNVSVRAISSETANGSEATSAMLDLQLLSGVTGRVIDGYIQGATVFTDTNDNQVFEASLGEVSAVTDQYGNFTLGSTPGVPYNLVMTGGFDVAANQAFEGVLTAPAGSTVVTPITTLMTALIESGAAADASAAQALVTTALGLPTGVDLTTFDPVQAALSADPVASEAGAQLYAAGVQVANTLALVTSVVTGAGASAEAAVAAAITQFAAQIENATGELNLTGDGGDTSEIEALINGAAVEAGEDVSAIAADIATIVADNNSAVETALAQADVVDVLTTVTQVAVVAQGDASAAVQTAGSANDASAAVAGYTGTALEDAVEAAPVGDVTPPLLGTAGDDTLAGDTRDDSISGLAGTDVLYGGAGNDSLEGGAGNDIFFGGAGNDVLDGAAHVQFIASADWVNQDRVDYAGATAGVTVDLGAGTATGDASVGFDSLIGMEGVFGTAHDDTLIGSSGFSDFYRGGAGNDVIIGNAGYDRALYNDATGGITLDLAAGVVTGNASVGTDSLDGVELVRGSNHGDTLIATGFTSAFVLSPSANAGDGFNGGNFNELEGLGGNDTIIGNGNTRLSYQNSTGAVTVNMGAGTATGNGSVGFDTFSGVAGVLGSSDGDTIIGSNVTTITEVFLGRGGGDTFFGMGGFDRADYRSEGAVTTGIHVSLAAGIVVGDTLLTGTDTLRSIEGVRGTVEDDIFDATGFSNISTNAGSSGNFNVFEGVGGNDTVIGNGNTQLAFSDARSGVTVDMTGQSISGTVYLGGSGTVHGDASVGDDTFSGVSQVQASFFDDTILGANNTVNSTEVFIGLSGDDYIDGRNGFDRVILNNGVGGSGGATVDLAAGTVVGADDFIGNDTLRGIEGIQGTAFDDTIIATGFGTLSTNAGWFGAFNEIEGHAGNDSIVGNGSTRLVFFSNLPGQTSGVTLAYTSGSGGTAFGAATGTDAFSGVNQITASNFADTIDYSAATNTVSLFAGTGNDVAFGNNLNTTLNMGQGSDTAYGGNGNDQLFGDGGDQVADTLYGGAGNDNFGDNGGLAALYGGGGNDTIGGNVSLSTLSGDAGNDTVWGGSGNSNTMFGGDDDDHMFTNGGLSTLYGGSGNDNVSSGGVSALVFGELGDDTVGGAAGNDTIDGGDGNDTLWGGFFAGPTGDDVLILGAGSTHNASGFDGNDTVVSGTGNNYIDGGTGIDTIDYSSAAGGVTVNLVNFTATGAGLTDFLQGVGTFGLNSFEAVVASAFDDTVTGSDGNDFLSGGAGGDTLDGGAGSDTLVLGAGDNTVTGGLFDSDTFVLGGGNDHITDMITGVDRIVVKAGNHVASGIGTTVVTFTDGSTLSTANYTFFGTSDMYNPDGSQLGTLFNGTATNDFSGGTNGTDLLFGNAGNDQLFSGLADDTLYGGNDNDGMGGGDGNDYLDGGAGNDNMSGNVNNDLMYGGLGNDGMNGNEDDDTLYGGDGTDFLNGGDGNDALFGGNTANNQFENLSGDAGDDTLDGGAGNDFAQFFGSSAGVTVNLSTGIATGSATGTDTLIGIEGVWSSNFADTITGDTLNNNLVGNGGNDVIFADYGNDFIQGGAGDDTVYGGFLFDFAVYNSIADFDTMDYFLNGTIGNGPVSVNLAAHTAVVSSGSFAGTDTLYNIEGIGGTSFNDTLIGGGGARSENFQGRAGDDTVFGDGIHQARIQLQDLNYTTLLNSPGVTITISGALNGAGTVTDGLGSLNPLGVGTDTFMNVNGFTATKYNDVFYGGSFAFKPADPTFTSAAANFQGNGGSDTVVGNGVSNIAYGDINATIAGGAGVVANLAAGTVMHGASSSGGLAGTDVVSGVRFVSGTNFNDTVYGGGTSAPSLEFEGMSGSQGSDTFFGGSGFDEMNFNDGNTLVTSGVTIMMNAGVDGNGGYGTASSAAYFGTDRFYSVESIRGSLLGDLYDATGFNHGSATSPFDGPFVSTNFNRFHGGAGNDTVIGNSETQLEYRTSATAGIVARFLGHEHGTVMGNESVGTDTFSGVYGIRDTGYHDTFYGSDANGNTADDMEMFRLAGGDDTVFGGLGFDLITYSDQFSGVTIDMGAGTAVGSTAGLDWFYDIEGASGSRSDDTIIGSLGNDFITGNPGNDSLDGGAGTADALSYFQSTAGVFIDLANGTVSDGYGTSDEVANFERITGSRYGDTIVGSAAAETLNGADGDDVLTGGAGADVFAFRPTVQTSAPVPPGNGNDTITDFNPGEDLIDLRADQFADGAAAYAAVANDGFGNAILTIPGGNSVLLVGVTTMELSAADFTVH